MTDAVLQAKLDLETERANRLETQVQTLTAQRQAVLKYLRETQVGGAHPTAVAVRALLDGS